MRSRQVMAALFFTFAILGFSLGIFAADAITYAADETLIHQVLDNMELEYELIVDNNGDPVWTFTHQGILITIISYDRITHGRYESLLFYTGWVADSEISLTRINDWNSSSRFGRAYVDDAGDPVIELDLLMAGGVTAGTIQEYIIVFTQAASSLGVALEL